MPRIHTHYDNLKVSRDAPPDVIRAAYRALSQKYHPDRNPGDDRAARIMTLVNRAYAVLSDPEARREHDAWISSAERAEQAEYASRADPPTPPPRRSPVRPAPAPAPPQAKNYTWLVVIVMVVLGLALSAIPTPKPQYATATPSATPPPAASAPPVAPAWVPPPTVTASPPVTRPAPPDYSKAPNGAPWPSQADYLSGSLQLSKGGLSTVWIDNTRNDAPVHGKLLRVEDGRGRTVREFFIPAHSSILLEEMKQGTYELRYRDLHSGALSRTDDFELSEFDTGSGTQYTRMEMTLYKVRNGNMKTERIAESAF